jgi:preprotein translocase subunit SecA
LTRSLEDAQKKVELYNYEIRKNVFQYDNILNTQRKQLFEARKEILLENIYQNLGLRYAESSLDQDMIELLSFPESMEVSLERIEKKFDTYTASSCFSNQGSKIGVTKDLLKEQKTISQELYKELWISQDLRLAHGNTYQKGFFKNTQTETILAIVDFHWTEHLERMGFIRETINWRAYGQQNPLIEYNGEAFQSFQFMFQQIRESMVYYFLENPLIR